MVCDERAPRAGSRLARKPRKAGAAPHLLPAQEEALAAVLAALGSGGEVLLHGVTGSGKTEVYLQAARAVLARGESVLMLVPEIGLTGQTVARVGERFCGERVAVLHSGLSAGERLAAYCAVAEGRARLVIGARSAVFAPMVDLGLIVVDEEHDASYKQETEPRYDARTVARWRAAETGAALVLGSATPSVESFARVPVAHRPDGPRRRLPAAAARSDRHARCTERALTGAGRGPHAYGRGGPEGHPVPQPARLRVLARVRALRP